MRKKISLLSSITISVISTFISLLIIEFALRSFGYAPTYFYPRYLFIPDSNLGYKIKPLFKTKHCLGEFKVDININSRGLRDTEDFIQEENGLRILALGDSFTFGIGVNQQATYPNQLEEAIRAQGINCEVINAGIPGYGTRQEVAFFKNYGLEYAPKIVILGFLMANDAEDNLGNYIVKNGFIITKDSKYPELPLSKFYIFKSFIRKHSSLYCFIVSRLKSNVYARNIILKLGLITDLIPAELQFYKKDYSNRVKTCYGVTKLMLRELKRRCIDNNTELLIIGIPLKTQVYQKAWETAKKQYALKDDEFDIDLPNKMMSEFCKEEKINFLDLLPSFRKLAQQGKQLYYIIDGHLNEEGHKITAKFIYSFLEEHKYFKNSEFKTN